MTRRIATVFGILLIFISAAAADPIAVRSGEHDKFTRLVMQLPSDLDWRLSTETGTATIEIDTFEDGFDLSKAFSIIPRTRLSAILSSDDRLELQLACDCPVKAFVEQDNYLVIDIADGPALPAAPKTIPAASTVRIPGSSFGFGDLLWFEHAARFPTTPSERTPDQNNSLPPVLNAPAVPPDSDIVLETRDRLLRGLADAASSGIVSVDEQTLELGTANPQIESEVSTEIFDSSEQPLVPTENPTVNVRITTSRDVRPSEMDIFQAPETMCPEPGFLEVANWGFDGPFGQQFSHPDVQLYNDAGNLIDGHVPERAKLYLYFGFGTEAKQIARLSPDLERTRPYLFDLADIFDYGHARAPRMLHQFAECDSDLALWAILAAQDADPDTPVNTQAALRALENLPVHLRGFVGRELSKRLIDRGDPENAGIALRSSERMEPRHSEDASLAKAVISETSGNGDASTEVLNQVIAQNSAESPEALVALVEQHLDAGQTVPPDIALAVEAFLFEFRNRPVGPSLTRALILASASSGQFSKAYNALTTAKTAQTLSDPLETESRLLSMLASSAEDIVFLRHVFESELHLEPTLDQHTLLSVAERLLDVGFPNEAEAVLFAVDSDVHPRKQRILEARLYLTKGDTGAVLNRLSDLEGTEVELLRAEAFRIAGDNGASRDAFLSANEPKEAAISGWTAENWTRLVNSSDPIFGPAKTLAEEQMSEITASETLLSETEKAIRSAEDARRALADLLNAVGSQ